jgi:adenine deaminase
MGKADIVINGKIVDVVAGEIYPGSVRIADGLIAEVKRDSSVDGDQYILPGLINAHGHVESSLMIPSQFAKAAVVHGDVGGVYDPHELANVCGIEGVRFMIKDGKRVPFKFAFGAPSCVPATNPDIETSGAALGVEEVQELLGSGEAKFLSEVMNAPAVIGGDPSFRKMIAIAREYGLPVDGHCPGFDGDDLQSYIDAGISTDHECTSVEEARDKLDRGLAYVSIREGSAAKNFEALHPLFNSHPERVMLCSDDIHPHDLVKGHMNLLVARAIGLGYDPIDVVSAVTKNPVKHYNLPVGLLQKGDAADLIVVDSLESMNLAQTYVDGELVAENGKCLFDAPELELSINNFRCAPIVDGDLQIPVQGDQVRVIGVTNGQLLTQDITLEPKVEDGYVVSDIERDICKLVVVNRYAPAKPAVALVQGLGLKKGALASSVSHDCHQIVAAGTNDRDLVSAINAVIEESGGLSVAEGANVTTLALPVGGIMSNRPVEEVGKLYTELHKRSLELGSAVDDSLMLLSFLALSVIPELKLTDKGLFKIAQFSHVPLFV